MVRSVLLVVGCGLLVACAAWALGSAETAGAERTPVPTVTWLSPTEFDDDAFCRDPGARNLTMCSPNHGFALLLDEQYERLSSAPPVPAGS